MIMSTFAETIEFRKFTLEPAKGQKQLTLDQITKVINDNHLGVNEAIKVNAENGKFSYTDTTTIKYASVYNDDSTIKEFDSQDLGTTIQGSTTKSDNHIRVNFKYKYSEKTKDIIYKAKGDRAILMPVFKSFKANSSVVLNQINNQWIAIAMPFPVSPDSKKQTYIALRVLNSKMQNKRK